MQRRNAEDAEEKRAKDAEEAKACIVSCQFSVVSLGVALMSEGVCFGDFMGM